MEDRTYTVALNIVQEPNVRTCLTMLQVYLSEIEQVSTRKYELYRVFCLVTKLLDQLNEKNKQVFKLALEELQVVANIEEFLHFGIALGHLFTVRFVHEDLNRNCHLMRVGDGDSLVHRMSDLISWKLELCHKETSIRPLIVYFVNDAISRELVPNYADDTGFTYFHAACFCGHVPAVRRFIEFVDININTFRFGPLHLAARNRHADVVQLLLDSGANPNQLDRDSGLTPLHILARSRVCDCPRQLVLVDHRCALHRSVEPIVDLLVKRGARIEDRSRSGKTALQLALLQWDIELTKALLRHGAWLPGLLNNGALFNFAYQCNFEEHMTRTFPFSFVIDRMMRAITSHEFLTRNNEIVNRQYHMLMAQQLRFLKCWIKFDRNTRIFDQIRQEVFVEERDRQGLSQESQICLEQRTIFVRSDKMPEIENHEVLDVSYEDELESLRHTMAIRNVSYFRIGRVARSKGHELMWNGEPPELLGFPLLSLIVNRHIGNIFMRRRSEFFIADYLTSLPYWNLPFIPTLRIIEFLDDNALGNIIIQWTFLEE
ncbi:uncharacterized protein LOC106649474 [Trichogramma pretiosum]|uniref:uncharacterized protein LOC106649474 n=1 Tax=Trichogramma pretiosum TaxID=7493 RepID=UPI0006C95E3E|nr:uncharacterized protein LOC106649474 [Trichogramma pretiosum]